MPWQRVKIGKKGTILRPVGKIEEYCLGHLTEKLYVSYCVFKRGKGQREEDVLFPFKRVLDFDTDSVATEEQFLKLSKMFPGCYSIWANGIQIFLAPSNFPAEVEAYMLAALGEEAAKRTGLDYDGHSLTKAGKPAKYQSHAYRAPWGYASRAKRQIKCFQPLLSDEGIVAEWDVEEAVQALGVKWSVTSPSTPVVAVRSINVSSSFPTSPSSVSKKRSRGEKYREFIEILRHRRALLCEGKTITEALANSVLYGWQYHTKGEIGRIYTHPNYVAYRIRSGGGNGPMVLSPAAWQGILNDQETLKFQLGPATKKRKALQTGSQVFKQRAWSFEWLYQFEKPFGLTVDVAVEAFFQWPEFKDIRDLSVRNIGRESTEKDLRGLWDRFLNREGLVASKIVQAVRQKAEKLKHFTRAKIEPQVSEIKSRRHLQRALKQLKEAGILTMTGKNKGAEWHIVGASATTTR